jgi:hypothetical protein
MAAEEALEAMGISLEDMEETERKLHEQGVRRYRSSDSRICACGHGVSRHTVINGVVYCKPSRMECPCKNCRPVIEVDDTRKFLFRTNGAGPLHALTMGMFASAKSGKNVKWIIDLKCDRCGEQTGTVVPVPVTQNGVATTYPTGYDALLCPKCRVEI